jgi:hypothetical protein
MSIDGGLTAIGGFLYQTVVALSLKADTFQTYHDAPTNKDDLETVLGFAKEGEVRYEDEDQDVSIRDVLHGEQPRYVLVQLKYSSVAPRPPITPYHLGKIISRLLASEEKVRAAGRQVTGYSLLTNRPLNADAQRMVNTYHPPFYVASSLPERYWEERMRQFARRFGCIDPEIETGIRQGIGDVLLRATNPRYYGEPVITREMMIEIFTRSLTAHELTPEIVAKKSQQQLSKLFTQSFHLDVQPLLVRQSLHKQLSELVERHAFVVLSGIGGNGKTAALWQWMDDCFASALPQQLGTYYCLSPSQWVREDFLAHQFCTWAQVPNSHHWGSQVPEQVLDRLEIARTASMKVPLVSHPIFVLGLDAVDEAFLEGDRNALRTLLMWFWEQEVHLQQKPRATLIVTCRDPKELAARWLNIASPYEDEPRPFRDGEVVVDEFSPSELVEVARLHLPTLAERFAQAYRALEVPSSFLASGKAYRPLEAQLPTFLAPSSREMEASSVLQSESPSLQAVDAEVFRALRHPTLWHCLLKVDETIQASVLDGETGALTYLATHFLSWFCHKVQARGNRVRDEEMVDVLKEIARHCDPRRSPRYMKQDWITHASNTPHMNTGLAASFFEEGLSAGLIAYDTGGWWRWRHPFIGEHLAMQPPSSEDE